MEGAEIKDFTTTSFGLVLAYLLPGVAGLISIALWLRSPLDLWRLAQAGVKEEGGAAALMFLGLLLAFLLGAIINGICMCTVDRLAMKRWEIKPSYFSRLNAESLACVTAAIDEFYRFYRFFGSLSIVAIASLLAVWPGRLFAWTEYYYPLAVYGPLLVSAVVAGCLSRKYYVEFAREILDIPPEDPAPSIKAIKPKRATAGGDLSLSITGRNFSRDSKIEWNSKAIRTEFVDSKKLRGTVPAAEVTAGQMSVEVTIPAQTTTSSQKVAVTT
ncbi:MAG: IPT/TIG domain-containing protein [Candidatus Sulfotelmatobacter sp.]|jgi:hypothetical protein